MSCKVEFDLPLVLKSYQELYSSKFIHNNSIWKLTFMPTMYLNKPTPNYTVLGLNLNHHISIYKLSSFIQARPVLVFWIIFGVT